VTTKQQRPALHDTGNGWRRMRHYTINGGHGLGLNLSFTVLFFKNIK